MNADHCGSGSGSTALLQEQVNTSDSRSMFNIPLTPVMPVLPRTEKSSNNLSGVLEDLGELCYGNNIPGFHENRAPLWSRGFSRNLGATRSSHLACNCLKSSCNLYNILIVIVPSHNNRVKNKNYSRIGFKNYPIGIILQINSSIALNDHLG